MTAGVGDATARKLLVAFGLPGRIFAQPMQALGAVCSQKQADSLLTLPLGLAELVETTWQWLQADLAGRRLLTLGHPQYPAALLDMEDPPLMLYAMGNQSAWDQSTTALHASRCIAVVGSRNPTAQGVTNAKEFSQSLAQAGLTIVSGLALGIDGAAHEGALAGAAETHIATVAIVGTGLDRVYPRHHRDLAHRIAKHGLILSEYPLGTPPLAPNFPKRNRIIAGLCKATLVVEAALKSGSLITARMAVDQGKDVFAIPGSIHSTHARGCHALIKQGAKLVETAQDILEEMAPTGYSVAAGGAQDSPDVSDDYSLDDTDPLHSALGFDPIGLDALLARTGMNTASLQVRLMELELEGMVSRLPGGMFQRLVRA